MHRLLGLGVAGALVACQIIVPSSIDEVHCTEDGRVGPPACPSGQRCQAGVCSGCVAVDACDNGVDDNCDGQVDEGCEHAGAGGEGGEGGEAGEGSGAAGKGAGQGGDAGASSEGGSSGQGGSAGEGGKGGGSGQGGKAGDAGKAGAGQSGASGSAGAQAGQSGGAQGGAGQGGAAGGAGDGGAAGSTPPPKQFGESCNEGVCDSKLECVSLGSWGYDPSESICSRPCCSSLDCGDAAKGLICLPSKHGGGMCVSVSAIGRGTAAGGLGIGQECSSNADCRSAWCAKADGADKGKCNDTCCSSSGCAGSVCGLTNQIPGSNYTSFGCGSFSGGNAGTPCPKGTDNPDFQGDGNKCNSGLCVPEACLGACVWACTKTCRKPGDCDSLDGALSDFGCDYEKLSSGSLVRVCVPDAGDNACASHADCASGRCEREGGTGALRCK